MFPLRKTHFANPEGRSTRVTVHWTDVDAGCRRSAATSILPTLPSAYFLLSSLCTCRSFGPWIMLIHHTRQGYVAAQRPGRGHGHAYGQQGRFGPGKDVATDVRRHAHGVPPYWFCTGPATADACAGRVRSKSVLVHGPTRRMW